MTSEVIQGHIKPLLCQDHSGTFVYGLILMKICMNANIMKTQFFHKKIFDLKCHFYVIDKLYDFIFFKTFLPNYNLYIRSYGQIFPCFINKLKNKSLLHDSKLSQ